MANHLRFPNAAGSVVFGNSADAAPRM